jgi:hypothetical protein
LGAHSSGVCTLQLDDVEFSEPEPEIVVTVRNAPIGNYPPPSPRWTTTSGLSPLAAPTAEVRLDDAEEEEQAVAVLVPHHLYDRVPTGVRDAEKASRSWWTMS